MISCSSGGEAQTTNNRMELEAVIHAIEDSSLLGAEELSLFTDSQIQKLGLEQICLEHLDGVVEIDSVRDSFIYRERNGKEFLHRDRSVIVVDRFLLLAADNGEQGVRTEIGKVVVVRVHLDGTEVRDEAGLRVGVLRKGHLRR